MIFSKRAALALTAALAFAGHSGLAHAALQNAETAPPALHVAADLAPGQWPQAVSDVEVDPDIRFGALPNGMRYAIRRQTIPEGQAALRLRIDAGSLMEADDQQGLFPTCTVATCAHCRVEADLIWGRGLRVHQLQQLQSLSPSCMARARSQGVVVGDRRLDMVLTRLLVLQPPQQARQGQVPAATLPQPACPGGRAASTKQTMLHRCVKPPETKAPSRQ